MDAKKLTGGDTVDFDQFGNFVSVSGNAVLVGAWLHSSGAAFANGAAYVFQENLGQSTQVAEVSASDGVSQGTFGQSVAISKQYVAH